VLRNQFVVYDDPKFIINNENLDLEGKELIQYVFQRHLYSPHYKPLVYFTWAMEKKLVGTDPFLFHLNNLILHLLNTFLIFWIVIQFIKVSGKYNRWSNLLALSIALFWAIHPLKVESVAWAMERKDVLFGFFFLTSLVAYMNFLRKQKYIWMIGGAILFGLGFISKSMVITLPVVLFLIDFSLGRKWSFKLIYEKIPYFIVVIIGFFLYGLFSRWQMHTEGLTEDILPMADSSFNFITDSNIFYRITFLSYRFMQWINAIIFPHDLAVMYPFPWFIKKGILPAYLYVWPILILFAIGLSIYLFKYTKIILAALLFFFVTIFPVVNMNLNESYISDRYTYMPILGFAVLFGLFLFRVLEIKVTGLRKFLIGLFGIYFIFIGVSTFVQARNWENGTTLFTDIINKYPDYGRAYLLRAIAREMDKNDIKGAISDCNKGIEVGPDKLSEAYYSRAGFKMKIDDFQGALKDYNLAIKKDPDFKEAFFNRGILHNKMGAYKEAIKDFKRALEYNFWEYESYYNIGSNYGILNDTVQAFRYLNKCLSMNNTDVKVHYNIGLINARNNNYSQAVKKFDQLLVIDPKHAQGYYNRGMAQYFLNNLNECCADLNQAKKYGFKRADEMIKKYCR